MGCFDCFQRIWALIGPALYVNFVTSKKLLIRDWRLGLTLRIFQLLVVVYIVFDLVTKASYLQSEVPKGTITPLASLRSGRGSYYGRIEKEVPLPQYCTNSSKYEYMWSEMEFKDFRCILTDPSSLAEKREYEYFFTTYFTMDKTFSTKQKNHNCSTEGYRHIPQGSSKVAQGSGACVYKFKQHFFPLDPEEVTLSFLHTYSSSTLKIHGALPKTYLVNDTMTIKEFGAGEYIELNLTDWLSYAGVDLDKRLDDQMSPDKAVFGKKKYDYLLGNPPYNTTFPYARVSGVEIVVTLKYYTRKLLPGKHHISVGKGSNDIVCILTLEPKFRWSLRGADVRYMINSPEDPVFLTPGGESIKNATRENIGTEVNFKRYGIQFTFKVQGLVGKFNVRSLVTALVTYSVMFSVAQILVNFMALYLLGLSSILYKEFIMETVIWKREYARFAAQAMVSGYAFLNYDTDDSWRLSRREIFKTLKCLVGHRLADDKLAALTDFLMRHGDEDVNINQSKLKYDEENQPEGIFTSTISIHEWVDIFSDDKVKMASLERLIDSEYKDRRTREALVDLAMNKKRKRALPGGTAADPLLENDDEEEEEIGDDVPAQILEFQRNGKQRLMAAMLQSFKPRGGGSTSENP